MAVLPQLAPRQLVSRPGWPRVRPRSICAISRADLCVALGQAVRDLGEGITDGPKKMCFGLCGGGANAGIGPCRNRDWGEELCGGRSGPPTEHGRVWVETMTA
eukprot:COSAG04_NODE_14380_length_570_cov_0.976645_1_plen_102_part_10